MKNTLAKIALFFLPFINATNAAETLLNCPAEISGELLQMQAPSPEWQGFVKSPLRWRSVSLMAGEPSTQTHLKPDLFNETKEKSTSTWKFVGDYPEGKWLSCGYVDGSVSLSKRIDDRFTECSVVYRKDKKDKNGYWVLGGFEKISCK
jgi:hypothetical protein